MKNKYVMISGLAMNEESDMLKLSEYAQQGWILKGIKAGFFYELEKSEPRDLIYSLDYEANPDEKYFEILKKAGWEHVLSVENRIHIFSAKFGTKPIYTDIQSEIDKYIKGSYKLKKWVISSAILEVILLFCLVISINVIKQLFLIILAMLMINMFVFVFNFIPYVAYSDRIKKIKNGKDIKINNTLSGKKVYSNFFIGALFLIAGLIFLSEKSYISAVFIVLGIIKIIEVKK